MSLVFVPVTTEQLRRWAESGAMIPDLMFGTGSGFRDTFGLSPADDEDAEYTCLNVAGLACLVAGHQRLVAVVELDRIPHGDELGRGPGEWLAWAAVQSLFTEGSPDLAARARDRFTGLDVSAAWDDPETDRLLREGDLLWHGPDEWGSLVGLHA